MKVFFDCEFTGLHKQTSLISIGCVTEDDQRFYAELTDYDQSQVDDWIRENVISQLHLRDLQNSEWGREDYSQYPPLVQVKGDRDFIRMSLGSWLSEFDHVEMWGDVLAYDWVLFCDLFGGAMQIPDNIYYIPFDVSTGLKLAGYDPDVDRLIFWSGEYPDTKHNPLHDACLARGAYRAIMDRIIGRRIG